MFFIRNPHPETSTGANWEENVAWLSGFECGFEPRVLGKASWSWSLVDVRAPSGKCRGFALASRDRGLDGLQCWLVADGSWRTH